jgi:hypothetical protein
MGSHKTALAGRSALRFLAKREMRRINSQMARQPMIGYIHIDIGAVRARLGKLNMFLPIERVSKFPCRVSEPREGEWRQSNFLVDVFHYRSLESLEDPAVEARTFSAPQRSAMENSIRGYLRDPDENLVAFIFNPRHLIPELATGSRCDWISGF